MIGPPTEKLIALRVMGTGPRPVQALGYYSVSRYPRRQPSHLEPVCLKKCCACLRSIGPERSLQRSTLSICVCEKMFLLTSRCEGIVSLCIAIFVPHLSRVWRLTLFLLKASTKSFFSSVLKILTWWRLLSLDPPACRAFRAKDIPHPGPPA